MKLQRGDILFPSIIIGVIVVVVLMVWVVIADGQTHTMPGSNVVPSGGSLTIQSGGSITAAAGSTVTGFGAGGGSGNVSNSGTPTLNQLAGWTDATHVQGITLGTNLSITGTTLNATAGGGAVSITATAPMVVTPSPITGTGVISTSMATDSILGRATASTGVVEVLSALPFAYTGDVTRPADSNVTTLAKIGALTTNGFVKTSGGTGALSVDTATYQASDADLTLWAAITPGTNVGTFLATPSSANLRGALTDENGTGAALFNAATSPDFTTSVTIGSVAVPTISSTSTFTNKRITQRVTTSTTSNTTPTPNADTDDMYVATGMTVNMVFGAPTGTPTDGQKLIIRIKDSGAARTLGFNAAYRFSTDLIAPTTTVISKTMYLGFVWNGVDSKWDCLAQRNNL